MVDASAYEVIMIVHELHQRGYEQVLLSLKKGRKLKLLMIS